MEKSCPRCLLRDMEKADREMIGKYLAAISAEDRTEEFEYERRLSVCRQCDRLNAGTCLACGCYVELRAAGKKARCPWGRWKKGNNHVETHD